MPNQKITIETDADPKTAYEDTTPHERPGFIIEDTDESGKVNKTPGEPNNS